MNKYKVLSKFGHRSKYSDSSNPTSQVFTLSSTAVQILCQIIETLKLIHLRVTQQDRRAFGRVLVETIVKLVK